MTNENAEKAKAYQSDSDLELKDKESYREFLCRHEYNGKECGFRVQAKTDDEVIEHARYASGNLTARRRYHLIWKRKSRQTLDPPR